MTKRLAAFFITLVSMFSLSFGLVAAPAVLAQNADDVCEGVSLTGGSCDSQGQDGQTVEDIIQIVINILSFVVGVIAVVMIIIGGLKYITSGGDSNSVNGAKNTILYAIVGLVVVAVAQIIVRFVVVQIT